MRPLAIDLFCGSFGWAAGFVAEGYRVIGFDLEHHDYHGPIPDNCELVLQDVLTLHGAQFKDAAVIVASPPCQAYSYRAMPWKRARALPPPDNTLFEACFRIQREACEAAGRHIPMVVENVRGAQKWVGKANWNYGSFYLWGDVPAVMPISLKKDGRKLPGNNSARLWSERRVQRLQDATKDVSAVFYRTPQSDGIKQGGNWWHDPNSMTRRFSSRSLARRRASAMIAKIPFALARHIARTYKPHSNGSGIK